MRDFVNPSRKPKISSFHVGRWQLAIHRQYVGDMYGYRGSDGWSIQFTFIRNPQ